MKGVLLNYHPGLYRFQESSTVAKLFNNLEQQLKSDLSLCEAYLLFSKFTASLKCGHTFCSFYNQSGSTKDSLFNKKDKVPFTFFLFDKKMFVEKNVSDNEELKQGTEVLEINNVPVAIIIDTLIQYVKGDGNNNLKRLNDLNLSGLGKFEAFDIFYPLLFPPINNSYSLKVKQADKTSMLTINVYPVSRAERFSLIESKYGKQPSTLDDLWDFKILNSETGYLKIGTFVTNKLTIDWKKFLSNAFDELTEKNIQNLIIDIRGNEGGDDEVNLVLGNKLAKRQIEFPAFKELLRYENVSDEFRPYINTWDKSFYNRSGRVIKQENGFYTWKKNRGNSVIKKNNNAFQGNTYLLVDAANSSATFFLTACLKQNKIATIVGSETGGNLKGTNGGQLFFLWLPNSKIEIDIPLIGYYPLTEQPDKGINPDIEIVLTSSDIFSGKDKVLDKTLELIKAK
ncbi:S41 family peptidase [Flavobacterium sp.]|uniref:S41 family peptidase n=1 Tax=Flavobacterium sp. TaxID=239 RepID=UPI00374D2096